MSQVPIEFHRRKEDPLAYHRKLADFYLAAPHVPNEVHVRHSYTALKVALLQQFRQLPVKVWPWKTDPYADCEDMFRHIEKGELFVYDVHDGLPEDHPMLEEAFPLTGVNYNFIFRAVHDYYGHYGGPRMTHHRFEMSESHGLFGEEAAYLRHRMSLPLAAAMALTCETRCQTAVNNLIMPDTFGPQKCVLLPTWAYNDWS